MQFDWFTYLAQLVNFGILILLLRRFLYGPIVSAMSQRQDRISQEFQEAEEKRQQAQTEEEHYREQRTQFEREQEGMLEKARREAREHREELEQEAREQVQEQQQQWRQELERDRARFLHNLQRHAGQQTLRIARSALEDLADEDLEQRIIHKFIQEIDSLTEDERNEIADKLQKSDEPPHVYSVFELDEEQRRELSDHIRDTLLRNGRQSIEFARAPELVCGLELRVDGRRVGWNIYNYMDSLQDRISQALEDTEVGDEAVGKESP